MNGRGMALWRAGDRRLGSPLDPSYGEAGYYHKLDPQEITGSDDYHYQLGGGLLVTAQGKWNVYAEVIPLGERAARIGASLSF